jgi:hypothetical protein
MLLGCIASKKTKENVGLNQLFFHANPVPKVPKLVEIRPFCFLKNKILFTSFNV